MALAAALVFSLSCRPKGAEFRGMKVRYMECCGEAGADSPVNSAILRAKKDIKIIIDRENSPAFTTYFDDIMAQKEALEPVDVIKITTENFADFYEAGLLEDLSPYINEDDSFKLNKFHEGTIDYFTREEKLFVIPRDISPMCAVYYNKQIFDEAGAAYPPDEWTIKEFIETAGKLVKMDSMGRVIQFGFVDKKNYWKPWVYAYDGRLVNDIKNPTSCFLYTTEVINGVKTRADLMHEYSIMPDFPRMTAGGCGREERIKMFTEGKAAMLFAPLTDAPGLRKTADFDWDITVFPSATGTAKAYSASATGFAIFKNSKNKELAWEFLKYLVDEESQEKAAKKCMVPARLDTAASAVFLGNNKPKNKTIVLKALPRIIYPPSHIHWDDAVIEEITPALESVWKGTESASNALGRIVWSINKYYLKEK